MEHEIRPYEELVKDYAKRKDNLNLPMFTENHLYLCRKELIFSSKDKIRIFTHDFFKNYHEFFYELRTRETEVITSQDPDKEIKNENLKYLFENPGFKMFALDFCKMIGGFKTRNELPSFMIVEPNGRYWEGSPEDNKANKLIAGITNFCDLKYTRDYIKNFDLLKANSNQVLLEGAVCI